MVTAVDPAEKLALDRFKEETLRKLHGVTCEQHQQAPSVEFVGGSLREIRISMRGCCDDLIALANRAIAGESRR